MARLRVVTLAGVLFAFASAAASAQVRVTIGNGRVSVTAKDATVRQILTEWARVGQVKIVNAERIPGGPVTLELADMPEDQALDLLLRSVSGYLAAPRATPAANVSRFDRVVVMATAAVARTPTSAAPVAQPTFTPAPPPPQPPDDDSSDEPPANAVPTPNPRGPVFNAFPQPQVVNPPQGTPSPTPGVFEPPGQQEGTTPAGVRPTAPGAVATPGMIVPSPPQPVQPDTRR